MDNEKNYLPIGFTVALAQNEEALTYFASLSAEMRQRIVEQTRSFNSKAEMKAFVDRLASEGRNNYLQ